jgi:hypothetical protein
LTKAQVAARAAAVADRWARGSRLIVNYQPPANTTTVGRLVARLLARSAGRRSMLADEPWRSAWTPGAMAGLLTGHGYTVTDDADLLDIAGALAMPIRHRRSLRHGQVMVTDRVLAGATG